MLARRYLVPNTRTTGSTPGTPSPATGVIAGHLLRQVRDQINLTQDELAEHLGVDPNTLKSWETGRRPLCQVKVATLQGVRRKLRRLGAPAQLLDRFDTAVDVDLFIQQVLDGRTPPGDHPLATWVSTKGWNDMLGWALTGAPVGDGHIPQPRLPKVDRTRFYDAIRTTAEQVRGDDPSAVLLRRQTYFLAARDDEVTGRDWLAASERHELRRLRRADGWTPSWVAARSLAVARACQGEPEQLRDFITQRLAGNDLCESANLNYWAYWIGEAPAGAITDEFMAGDLGRWRGTALLGHLVDGLDAATPYLELSVHTLWALVERRPYLLHDEAAVTNRLVARIRTVLDDPPPHLGPDARRELDHLHYAARMTARGPR
jgi:transcriptional regulator with XRE-family HTH domain